VDSLIIASKSKGHLNSWVDAFTGVYPFVLIDNIEELFSDKYEGGGFLLVIDAAYIESAEQMMHICQYVKKVVVVGSELRESVQIQFILSGASGYSDINTEKPIILRAIAGVLNNEIWLERQVIPRLLSGLIQKNNESKGDKGFNYEEYSILSILSKREVEVIDLIYRGTSNSDMAEILKISNRTVKAHLSAIYRKLKVDGRFQLIVYLKDLHVSHLAEDFLDV